MKKIALIVPWVPKIGQKNISKSLFERNIKIRTNFGTKGTPNPSLLTIAGFIPDRYDVSYIDEINRTRELSFQEHFDIVVLSATTNQINRVYEIARQYKNNGAYVVLGGPHATVLPDEALENVDTVFIGEGEDIFSLFLRDYEKSSPKQVYRNERYVDLSKSPIPRYDLIDSKHFSFYCVQTTRGCPRGCNYCSIPIMYGTTYRHKDVHQVINEIKAIQKIDVNAFIFLSDDNMFINREFSKNLLREIAKLGIKWGTQTDISIADDNELMELIHESGCQWCFIGFENVTKGGLDFLVNKQWKAKRIHTYETAIEKIHDNGINIWGGFMFGGDNDTNDIFGHTLDFIFKHGLYSCSFAIVTPFPGTQLYKQMVDSDRIIEHDWNKYSLFEVVFKPRNMTPGELAKGVEWMYLNYYANENVIDQTKKGGGAIWS